MGTIKITGVKIERIYDEDATVAVDETEGLKDED